MVIGLQIGSYKGGAPPALADSEKPGLFKAKATSHSTIFPSCKYAIKDINDTSPAKGGQSGPYW